MTTIVWEKPKLQYGYIIKFQAIGFFSNQDNNKCNNFSLQNTKSSGVQNTCQHVTVIQICSVVDRARVSTRDGFKLVATICNPSCQHFTRVQYLAAPPHIHLLHLPILTSFFQGWQPRQPFSSQLAPFPNEKRSNNNGIYKYILVTDHQISLLDATERIQRLVQ